MCGGGGGCVRVFIPKSAPMPNCSVKYYDIVLLKVLNYDYLGIEGIQKPKTWRLNSFLLYRV